MVKKGGDIKKPRGKSFKIIGFILGIIGFAAAFVPIIDIFAVIASIIGLVFSVVALKRSDPDKKKLASAGLVLNILAICIGIFTILITGGILWLIFGSGGVSSGSEANRTFANYTIGQTISSGNVSVIVISAVKSKQIENNQGQIIPLETTGDFLSVKLNVNNGNLGTLTISGDPFAVIDNQGRMFFALSGAERYYPNSVNDGTQVQPGVLFNGIKIFEVSGNSTGLTLEIILNETNGAYVKLE